MDWKKILSEQRLKTSGHYQDKLPDDLRNDFDSDQGRVIFSPSIRRMHDKTQVFPLNKDDHVHTRLTHTLEVVSIARSFGVQICKENDFVKRTKLKDQDLLMIIPTILSTISLCHDIGNPPFGHYGETVISNYFDNLFKDPVYKDLITINDKSKLDFTNFNGNPQGFRLISSLQVMQDPYGLNLTSAVLYSYLKYPNLSDEIDENKINKTYKNKIGVFQSEKDKLYRIREITGLNRIRHPLAFLMEAADSICYLVMDLEDAVNVKAITVEELIESIKEKGNENTKGLMFDFEKKVLTLLNKNKSNYKASMVVQLRVYLIKHLASLALQNFMKNIELIENGDYEKELIFDGDLNLASVLMTICKDKVFTLNQIRSLELTGESVIQGLLNHFAPTFLKHKSKDDKYKSRANKLYGLVSNSLKYSIELETGESELHKLSDYHKLRLIVDFISGMTDYHALGMYQKLQGINIS